MNYLVIGYGNTLRNDDGAGYYVADTVAEWALENVRSLPCHQLTPELADDIAQTDVVIFVDAAVPDKTEIKGIKFEELKIDQALPKLNLGHGLAPTTLLVMAQTLYGAAPTAYLILIPTQNFDIGEQVSPQTQDSIAIALQKIDQLISSTL